MKLITFLFKTFVSCIILLFGDILIITAQIIERSGYRTDSLQTALNLMAYNLPSLFVPIFIGIIVMFIFKTREAGIVIAFIWSIAMFIVRKENYLPGGIEGMAYSAFALELITIFIVLTFMSVHKKIQTPIT